MFYDVKFGRKREPEKDDAAESSRKDVSNGTANGVGHVKNTAELAIYEQYRTQVLPIGFLERPLCDFFFSPYLMVIL